MLTSLTKTFGLIVLLMLCVTPLFAQHRPLTNSRTTSYYTYVYALKPNDVLRFYQTKGKQPDESLLHTLIDSFKTDSKQDKEYPPGNYLKVYAIQNRLQYDLVENRSAFVKMFKSNLQRRFVLTDKAGNYINDAKVTLDGRAVDMDKETGSWSFRQKRDTVLLRIEYAGVSNFYRIAKEYDYYARNQSSWFKRVWSKVFKKKSKYRYAIPKYSGFIVFNKPKYKPRDTVNFKALVFDNKTGKPIKEQVAKVMLYEQYEKEGKLLGRVNSYCPGAFSYSFVLSDSLDLSLDENYLVGLVKDDERKSHTDKDDENNKYAAEQLIKNTLTTGNFEYEEYELKAIKFNARLDKDTHRAGEANAVFVKATDENDLPVPDGRVTLTVLSEGASNYVTNKTFVKDTLWTIQQAIDPVGETKITLPDSIFPKADVSYKINARFLNSNNEVRDADLYGSFKNKKAHLKTDAVDDKFKIVLLNGADTIKTMAYVSALTSESDTLSKVKIQLPGQVDLNQQATSYNIETDDMDEDVEMRETSDGLLLSGERTRDSVMVVVDNPRKLKFFYALFDGAKRIAGGQATDKLDFRMPYPADHLLTLSVDYVWAGQMQHKENSLVYEKNKLTITVKQPVTVSPGQRAETTIMVTDITGKPVPGADVTAWSFTRKFENYSMPNVPDFGRYYPAPKRYAPYIVLTDNTKDGSFKLDWLKQGKRLGLDSIAYFKFTHPVKSYAVTEAGKDTITQIAPFVVQKGELLPVYVVYIDMEPVYFSKAQQLQPYSFKVLPGMHHVRLRTAGIDIAVDSVMVPRGGKFIISFNADAFAYQKRSDTLDRGEAAFINSRMLTINNNFNERKTLLKQDDKTFFLNPFGFAPPQVLVGPLAKDYSIFETNGMQYAPFNAEPNYAYLFEPGWVKQKSLPTSVAFDKFLVKGGADNYRQYVLSNNDIDSLWNDYLDERANRQTLITNDAISGITGQLVIERLTDHKHRLELIKNIILFKKDDINFIRVYPGNTTDFGKLNPGKYKAFYLLKYNNYEVKDNIEIKANGVNYYKTDISPVHCSDAVSKTMAATIAGLQSARYRTYQANEDAKDRLREAYNSKYLNRDAFNNLMRGVVIGADDRLPLPGVMIKVKGTDVGANTRADGTFEIAVPEKGKLIISFIGFESKEVNISPNTDIRVELKSVAHHLNEVVVVGYGSARRKSVTGAVTTITMQNALAGKVAGIQVMADSANAGAGTLVRIRGAAGFADGKPPLYVVDGVLMSGLKDIPAASIESISVLQSAAATALYGAQAANGVIIINTKQSGKQQTTTELQAGQEQHPTVRRNFKDYAYWQPKLITDEQGKATFATTFPDDITNWRTFVIAANGNRQTGAAEGSVKAFRPLSANFIAPQFAIAGDEMKLIGKVMNYNAAPAQVTRSFTYNSKLSKQDQFSVSNAKIDTLAIVAADKDSISFEYSVKQDNYFDGEQRTVPVYKAGVTETKGQFAALQGDTSLTMSFDRSLGRITFRAEASVLPVLLQEAEHLRNYKYLCNEQLASKLKGLIAEKRIANALNQDFKYDRNVKDIIKKLTDNRKTAGTWGWWKDSEEEMWISLHATEALLEAEEAGFTTPLDKQKLIDYLVYQLGEYHGADKLQCLQMLTKLKAKADYPKLINTVAAEMAINRWTTNYSRLQLLSLKQQQGIKINIDSLQAKARRTMFGNLYWGDESYRLFDNSIQETVLAYQIMKKAGKSQDMLARIRGYLLEQRKSGQWRNTYESARVLETLLPDVLDENGKAVAKLILKGATEKVIDKFPYVDTLTADKITLTKTGKMPVYVTGYQQFWNSKPQKVDKDFMVDTWFEEKGKKVTALKAGETVYLQAKVQVKANADHVMVEIPIPAGCSYEEKDQQWANNEVHREHFKEKVSIFCSKLKQGTYMFKVKLMPRYGGKYTLNPAKAELMYFPVFYGREAIGKVEIK